MQKETLNQQEIVLAEVRDKLSKIILHILHGRDQEDALNKLIEELDEVNGNLRLSISRKVKGLIRRIIDRLSVIAWDCLWGHNPLEIVKSLNKEITLLDKLFGVCIRKRLWEEKKKKSIRRVNKQKMIKNGGKLREKS